MHFPLQLRFPFHSFSTTFFSHVSRMTHTEILLHLQWEQDLKRFEQYLRFLRPLGFLRVQWKKVFEYLFSVWTCHLISWLLLNFWTKIKKTMHLCFSASKLFRLLVLYVYGILKFIFTFSQFHFYGSYKQGKKIYDAV